jgi:tetratricopeptide (TPR) repeat protein
MIGLALLAVLVAYALRLPAEERTAEPPVGPGLSVVTADMAALRELASQAIAEEDWAQTIPLLGRMQELAPDDDGVRQQLAVSHLRRGLQLADQGHLDEAIAHYDAAIRFYANDVDLQTARRLAIGYRDGRQALDEERWDQAAELLEPVYKLAPDFRDVADLLFTTYVQQAASLEGAERLEAARDAYARAVEIRPGAGEVRARLAEIASILTPPTPTPTPRPRKRIVISVSEQRLRAYEDEALVFDWLCSTGDMARPTRYGEFEVLNKIPEAWSSVWGLRMPYWLGIYWAGGSQNGIHALPIDRSGQQLWAGFLGHRVSYGCVILDTPNAARLYDWAEIGTPVTIEP